MTPSPSHAEPTPASPAAPEPHAPPVRARRLSRRAAFALAGGTLGVLGIGWLADVLATAPLAKAPTGPLTTQVGIDHVTLDLRPSPPQAGAPTRTTVTVMSADGTAVAGLTVELAATMPAMGMALPTQRATPQAGATSYGCALLFGMAGEWRVEARFTAPGEAPRTASFQVVVR